MPEAFHFQQPAWFLALLPLGLLIWRLGNPFARESDWHRVCDTRFLPYLLIDPPRAGGRLPLWLVAAGWLIAVIALADPVWEKRPQPVFRSDEARVVVLDLSRSMAAADPAPSRLERARYKVEDVFRRSREGQVGLVVFAGDAFVVSPLTNDAATITELLHALDPALMPVQGSRADLGLRKAGVLLAQAGAAHGEILLIADGYEDRRALDAAGDLKRQGYTVSVLGVGTKEGAPLADGTGGYVRDAAGAIVVPRLDPPSLRLLAETGGGHYATLTADDADLDALLAPLAPRLDTRVETTGLETDAWVSHGPWLALLLLPLAALAFRRGWLLGVILLVAGTVTPPQPAMASTWDDLWMRRDQQAAEALAAGNNARAAELAADPSQRGTAQYRAGQYKQALEAFSQTGSPEAAYNRGNALARLGRYEEAIAAYDQALSAQPHMEDALHNKAVVEALLRQEQEKKQQQQKDQQQQQGTQLDQQQDRKQGQQGSSQTQQKDETRGQQAGNPSAPSSQQEGKAGDTRAVQDASPQDGNGGRERATAPSAKGDEAGNQPMQKRSAEATRDGQQNTPESAAAAVAEKAQPNGRGGEQARDGDHQPASGEAGSLAKNAGENPAAEAPEHPRQADATAQRGAAGRGAGEATAGNAEAPGAQDPTDPQTTEEQQATEQWLRRIPDDPGGLLRRKFLYQYRQRAAAAPSGASQSW